MLHRSPPPPNFLLLRGRSGLYVGRNTEKQGVNKITYFTGVSL